MHRETELAIGCEKKHFKLRPWAILRKHKLFRSRGRQVIMAAPFVHHHRLLLVKWVLPSLVSSQEAKTSAAVHQPFRQGDKHGDTVSLTGSSHWNQRELTRLTTNSTNEQETWKLKKQHFKGQKKSPRFTDSHGSLQLLRRLRSRAEKG